MHGEEDEADLLRGNCPNLAKRFQFAERQDATSFGTGQGLLKPLGHDANAALTAKRLTHHGASPKARS